MSYSAKLVGDFVVKKYRQSIVINGIAPVRHCVTEWYLQTCYLILIPSTVVEEGYIPSSGAAWSRSSPA
jgi:hypothetical protein